MRVLAIDPGYDRLGVAVLERTNNRETLLYSNCVITDTQADLPTRLLVVGEKISDLIATYQPSMMAIENLFFNKNQKTAIGVAQVRGICVYLGKQADCQVVELGPQEIKIAITGYGKSDKRAVIDMVCRLVTNTPTDALDDEYDAIAVGITALAQHRG